MFNVGDRVVYPMYGAGVIEGIETRDVDGQELSYYVLHIPIGDLKILISKSKADVLGLRALNSAEEVITQCNFKGNNEKEFIDSFIIKFVITPY